MLIVPVVVAAYLATNLDNLILLVGLLARYTATRFQVIAGYFAGMLLLGAASLAVGKAAEFIPVAYLGWLGVVPIAVGVYALVGLFTGAADGAADPAKKGAAFGVTLLTQLSNGADTVVTFSILIADTADGAEPWLIGSFIGMAGVFAATATLALAQPRIRHATTRYGRFAVPLLMICVGAYVLTNTLTDTLPG